MTGTIMTLKKILKNSDENTDPFLELEVPDLPYDFPITYREYESMRTYFCQKYMDYHLNKEEEQTNGIKLYSQNFSLGTN